METRGRRALRGPGPIDAPVEPGNPAAAPGSAIGSDEAAGQPPTAADILAEAATPAETALNLVAAAANAPLEPSIGPVAPTTDTPPGDLAVFDRGAFAAMAQSQSALANGLEALSAELAGLAVAGIDTAARTAGKMLAVKTLSDAIDVNAGFACSSLDALVGGSAKLSALAIRVAAETSRPLLSQLGKGWRG